MVGRGHTSQNNIEFVSAGDLGDVTTPSKGNFERSSDVFRFGKV